VLLARHRHEGVALLVAESVLVGVVVRWLTIGRNPQAVTATAGPSESADRHVTA
jgi:hypothetical protein